MNQEPQLYLRLPTESDIACDSLTIPMVDNNIQVVALPQRERISVPIFSRREVTLEEIANHDHFSFLTLGDKIGMGGLAAVYRMMNQSNLGFALKVPLKVTSNTYGLYNLEAHLLRELRRKGAPVPELASHGIVSGFPYLLMDDLGLDFLQNSHIYHNSYGRVEKVTRVGLSVCYALAALHELGYRHNDVKPANIHYILSGKVHLLDYASSSRINSSIDSHTFSPRYLAPERVTDDFPVDEKVDVFGLGITLYELLTDHPAFMSTQEPGTISALHEHVHLVKTAGYAPLCGYSPRLTSLVRAMMEYNPSDRPTLPAVQQALDKTRMEYFD